MTRQRAQDDKAITALKSLLGQRLSLSKSDLALHGRSESYFAPMLPDAVAYPQSTEEVSKLVAICAAHELPVVAWGTGTSLEGHSLAVPGAAWWWISRAWRGLSRCGRRTWTSPSSPG